MLKNIKVLIVDDNPDDIKTIAGTLAPCGASVITATDGTDAIAKAKQTSPEVILLDIKIPKINGYDVCKILKSTYETASIPIILITAFNEKEAMEKGFAMGADDFLGKPINEDVLKVRIRALANLKHLADGLRRVEDVLFTIVHIVDAKDSYTRGHSERVTKLSLLLAKELQMGGGELKLLERAAKLHDIGKIAVAETILNKPGVLTPEEFAEIRKHSATGEEICSHLKLPQKILKIIRHHHERFDGKGYPDGIKGNEISVGARIIAVVDCYDAMSTDRPYRAKLPKERIISIFNAGVGTQWDATIAKTFVKMLEENKIPES
jgi:putative two-component system response regulator